MYTPNPSVDECRLYHVTTALQTKYRRYSRIAKSTCIASAINFSRSNGLPTVRYRVNKAKLMQYANVT